MHLLLSLCILSSFLNSLAQCPNTAPVVNSYLAPTNLGGPAVVRTFTAGTSQIMTTMTLGFTYQVDTCTNSALFDPELSVLFLGLFWDSMTTFVETILLLPLLQIINQRELIFT